jgi:hypothetical protein
MATGRTILFPKSTEVAPASLPPASQRLSEADP